MGINLELVSDQAIQGVAMTHLIPLGTPLVVTRGAVLFREGEPLDSLFLVREGSLLIHVDLECADRAVPVEIARRGTLLGLADLMEDRHGETAHALSECRLIAVDVDLFLASMRRSAEFALLIVSMMSMGLRHRIQAISQQRTQSARGRLIAFLLSQISGRAVEGASVLLPMPKATLAAFLGITPQSFSRLVRQVRQDGVFIDGEKVVLSDPARLKRLVEDAHADL